MSGFGVEPAELYAAQSTLADAAEEGRAELARLRASGEDLLGHGWLGAAATAFGEGWQDWMQGASLVLSALAEMSQALGVTARDYAQSESANRAGFERIAS